MSEWIIHNGTGRPVPVGTVIDVIRFNGQEEENVVAGRAPTVDRHGNVVCPSRGRYSAWDYSDGGPMGVKYRAYRIRKLNEQFSAQIEAFRSLLDVREEEMA